MIQSFPPDGSDMTSPALSVHTSALHSLPLLARGKVRDNYAVGDDRILMVASSERHRRFLFRVGVRVGTDFVGALCRSDVQNAWRSGEG